MSNCEPEWRLLKESLTDVNSASEVEVINQDMLSPDSIFVEVWGRF